MKYLGPTKQGHQFVLDSLDRFDIAFAVNSINMKLAAMSVGKDTVFWFYGTHLGVECRQPDLDELQWGTVGAWGKCI